MTKVISPPKKATLNLGVRTQMQSFSADFPTLTHEFRSPIKWPGGKANEFAYIKHLIPQYDRYFEPFFGGGAIFFKLQPKQAIINDFSPDLMDFYRFLKGEYSHQAFSKELYEYVDNWQKIPVYIERFEDDLVKLYGKYKNNDLSISELEHEVNKLIEHNEARFNGLFSNSFCISRQNLINQITSNLISKIQRTSKIEQQKGPLAPGDLEKNLETAFRSGFYMHFRDIMNNRLRGKKISQAKKTANFYFIREFCYGSMFRYNAAGEFNIPYGGIAYNSKDFRRKVDRMLSNDFRTLFNEVNIDTGDFETSLNRHKPTSKDFIFLDPPYDSDFSAYDNQAFGIQDHERLAKYLYGAKAKWMLLIKETPFINSLYRDKRGINIQSFDKQYLYNVKGRNNQSAKHLIIYNY